jgi:hypothetical protein
MAIVVEFIGGFRDGLRWSTDSPDRRESNEAAWLWCIHEGIIGKKIGVLSEAATEPVISERGQEAKNRGMDINHFYTLIEKVEDGTDTIIRYEYSQETG